MAFLIDAQSTATFLMLAGEHGSLAVVRGLRHLELLPENPRMRR